MHWALCFALLVGCSFQHGVAPNPVDDARSDGDMPIDAPDARMIDAPVDAHMCPADYTTLSGGQPTSRYKMYGYSGAGGSSANAVMFNQAQMTCASAGAYVAIPNDASELAALDAITQNPGQGGYWVGITDTAVEGTWRTVLGDVATYLPWAAGQPNGGNSADCVVGFQQRLYDIDCPSSYVFTCECTQ